MFVTMFRHDLHATTREPRKNDLSCNGTTIAFGAPDMKLSLLFASSPDRLPSMKLGLLFDERTPPAA
jgi:hypothetical protein